MSGQDLSAVFDRILADAEREEHESGEPSSGCGVVRLADVEERPVRWLVPGLIPLGALSLLVGPGGHGKTCFALHVAARLSRGQAALPGLDPTEPGATVIVSAEDGIGQVLRPRLRLAGADLRRIHAVDLAERGFTVPEDVDWLASVVRDVRARLVILDPLSGFLGGRVDSHKDASLRGALRPLHALGESTGAAVLGITHVNKSMGSDIASRVSGSAAWINAARSALLFGREPDAEDDDPRRIVALGKSNYSPLGVAYELTLKVPPGEAHPVISVVGESSVSARDLLAVPASAEDHSALGEAVAFLEDALADGPRIGDEVKAEAKREDLSARTIQRARERLGVTMARGNVYREAVRGPWWWRLPDAQGDPKVANMAKVTTSGNLGHLGHLGRDGAPSADDLTRWETLALDDIEGAP